MLSIADSINNTQTGIILGFVGKDFNMNCLHFDFVSNKQQSFDIILSEEESLNSKYSIKSALENLSKQYNAAIGWEIIEYFSGVKLK